MRFQNGERTSVLIGPHGLPVHEVTLFLDRFRTKGRAANTIHLACCILAFFYGELCRAVTRASDDGHRDGNGRRRHVDLVTRFERVGFLEQPELDRLASCVQLRVAHLEAEDKLLAKKIRPGALSVTRIGKRLKSMPPQTKSVDVATQANRLRYIANYLEFLGNYVAATLSGQARNALERDVSQRLAHFRAHIPDVPKRASLDARQGLTVEEQDRLVHVVHPMAVDNPWKFGFVRKRNWLIVLLYLATGMRKGELLGLQIGDLETHKSELSILRRADAVEDTRRRQEVTKTRDRRIQLTPFLMKAIWRFINEDRYAIRPARKIPQIFVSDEGDALSSSSIDKMFAQLRAALPGLSVRLSSHVGRHSWNERFSEYADKMNVSEAHEKLARNHHQGWNEDSDVGTSYTRRHTQRIANEISLKLQKDLEDPDESYFRPDE